MMQYLWLIMYRPSGPAAIKEAQTRPLFLCNVKGRVAFCEDIGEGVAFKSREAAQEYLNKLYAMSPEHEVLRGHLTITGRTFMEASSH